MEKTFKACNRKQILLLPPSLLDWLSQGHLSHFILDVVEQLPTAVEQGGSIVSLHGGHIQNGRRLRSSPIAPMLVIAVKIIGARPMKLTRPAKKKIFVIVPSSLYSRPLPDSEDTLVRFRPLLVKFKTAQSGKLSRRP